MKINTPIHSILIAGLVLVLTACGPESASHSDASTDAKAGNGSPVFLLDEVPDSAPGLLEALQGAGPGESFTFIGRVGGTVDPLSADFAGFVVADEVLVFCDEMGDDDHCSTPWDACCEDPGKIAGARAFVQFVDESGLPLPVNLADAVGLAANDTVFVRGSLSPDSTPGNRIILAEALAIRP